MKAESKMGFVEGNAIVALDYNRPKTAIGMLMKPSKVGGLVASVVQPILSGIAKMIVKDFFKKIATETKPRK